MQRILAALLAVALCGCNGGSSGGASSSLGSPGSQPGSQPPGPAPTQPGPAQPGPATHPGSPSNAGHWQTALAALASAPTAEPVSFDPASAAAFNDLIATGWTELLPRVDTELSQALHGAIGQGQGGLSILSIGNIQLAALSPPAIASSASDRAELQVPRAPDSWGLTVDFVLSGSIPINVGGSTLQIPVQATVTAEVSDLSIRLPVEFDLSDPLWPEVSALGMPQITLQLSLSSGNALLQPLTGLLTQILDPVIRGALSVVTLLSPALLPTALQYLPDSADWGHGGAPITSMGMPNLESLAVETSHSIQTEHCPFGHVYPARMAQAVGGPVSGWEHHGDSALWTGAYLGAEAYRYDLLGGSQALAYATRIVEGIDIISQVVPAPYEGLLARAAIPVSSAHVAPMQGASTYFTGSWGGQTWGALGDTSRDSYAGVQFGLGQAWHRIPSLRSEVAAIIRRLLDHLVQHGWTVHQAPGQANNPTGDGVSVSFAQTPSAVLSLATIGAVSDAPRYGALRDQLGGVAPLLWFSTWASSREVHEVYFGFNLFQLTYSTLFELDTNPDRYREYLKALRIMRAVTGHHQNPWFDTVWAMAVPTEAPLVRPQIEQGLAHWSLRGRRSYPVSNSTDPSIAKTLYVTQTPNVGHSPGSTVHSGTRSWEVALHPVPIEKRPCAGFLWDQSPFKLDKYGHATEQQPGIDLVLPWWMARNHGIVP